MKFSNFEIVSELGGGESTLIARVDCETGFFFKETRNRLVLYTAQRWYFLEEDTSLSDYKSLKLFDLYFKYRAEKKFEEAGVEAREKAKFALLKQQELSEIFE